MPDRNQKKRKGTPRPTCVGNKFALGNKGGRPREWTAENIETERLALIEWAKDTKNYFITSFLNQRNLSPEHLCRFSQYSEEFREALERAKCIQEERLVDLAVTRKGDPGFIKFILQNKSGWKDKSEVSSEAGNPLAIILEKIGQTARDPLDGRD
jgi:hypothetical protein